MDRLIWRCILILFFYYNRCLALSIIPGVSDKSFDEFNICMFCGKQNFRDLALWPCFHCLKDHPILYRLKTDFIPLDKIAEIEAINGPHVWQYDRFAQAELLARQDKSSKEGKGPCDKIPGPFIKGSHTASPCNMLLIQYWAQVLNQS